MGRMNPRYNSALDGFAHFVSALQYGPLSADDLADLTGLHKNTIARHYKRLRKANGAHIGGYADDAVGRQTVPLIKLGEGKDAKRPKKKPNTVKKAEARRRVASVFDLAGKL